MVRQQWNCTALLLILALLGPTGCRRESQPANFGRVILPSALELYAVVAAPAEDYSIAVDTVDGRWYREAEPGANLATVTINKAGVVRHATGCYVLLPVQEQHRTALRAWMNARLGKHVVFMLEGECIGKPLELTSATYTDLAIPVESMEVGEELLSRIRLE